MLHGILNVYKEKGYTSHDVVAKLRGITGQRKIGHTGTLDPDAEGVLPVCLGRATKICELLTDRDKTYEAVLLLGKETDTQDISGKVTGERDAKGLDEGEVRRAIGGFVGGYQQIPPMYSARKINGKKLYELAREGREIERSPRPVSICGIRIESMDLPRVRMEITCSKGTYIRTLCHDIGRKLGVGGCMESLTRTRVGEFAVQDSRKLAEIRDMKDCGRLEEWLIPIEKVFERYRRVRVDEKQDSLLYNGNVLYIPEAKEKCGDGELIRVCDSAGSFAALYRYDGSSGKCKIAKMFFNERMTEESLCSI